MNPAWRPWVDRLLLTAAVVAAAVLRFRDLGRPSFWLDEILGYDLATGATQQPLWRWIVGFDNEHGQLYYLTELAGRFVRSEELSARLMPAVFGVLCVVVCWFAAARLVPEDVLVRAAAALLVAFSPLHVYYSREARPYALLMLLAALLQLALLAKWSRRALALMAAAAALTSATAAPLLAACAVAAFVIAGSDRGAAWRLATPPAVALLAWRLLYREHRLPVPEAGFPALDGGFFDDLLHSFSVAAVDDSRQSLVAYLAAAMAIAGAVVLLRRNRWLGAAVAALAILPVAAALAGLAVTNHWYSVRYVTPALPAYLVAAAVGIGAISRCARRGAPLVAFLLTGAIVYDGFRAATLEPFAKLDWRTVASSIGAHAREGDVVVADADWAAVSLGFYLGRQPRPLRLVNARGSVREAERHVGDGTGVWVVAAGHTSLSEVAGWACGFPIVLASPFERLRVHYAGGAYGFLAQRSTAASGRAFRAGSGSDVRYGLGPSENPLLGPGWEWPEGEGAARWIKGHSASFVVPPPSGGGPRVVGLTMMAATEPQRLDLFVNGRRAATRDVAHAWRSYEIPTDPASWSAGVNEVRLEFATTAVPAEGDPSYIDRRPLAAMVDEIVIGSGAGRPVILPLMQAFDGAGRPSFLELHSAWRRKWGNLPLGSRSGMARLAGRLGHDPEPALAAIERGDVTLGQLTEGLEPLLACADDATFYQTAHHVLLAREAPRDVVETARRRMERERVSRLRILREITGSSDFRRVIGTAAARPPE